MSPKRKAPVGVVDVSDVVERVIPAVVSIVISKDVHMVEKYYDAPFGYGVPLYRDRENEQVPVGGGSGFLVSKDGYVVTNGHVVSVPEAAYTVFTNDGSKYEAKIVAVDSAIDLALLKISAKASLPFMGFGNSDKLRLGQAVIAIGNALGEFRNTVSTGVVSGLSRSLTAGDGHGHAELLENIIQTDAAINPGHSGGPLVNLEGDVVGVNFAMVFGSSNIGFSLPANVVRASIESMKKYGRPMRPYLGISYVPVTKAVQLKRNLSVDYGAILSHGEAVGAPAVAPRSPAEKAGLCVDDIILEMNGVKVSELRPLSAMIRTCHVGDEVKLKILRKGKTQPVKITLEEMPEVKRQEES